MPGLEDRLGHVFRDRALLVQALTHPSALKEGRSPGPDYQRLEFLGDAVLQLGVSLMLYSAHPGAQEGALSFLRQELVRRESLAAMARRAGLREEMVVGSSVETAGPTGEDSVLADAMEAVLGAAYLDGGGEAAFAILEKQLGELPGPAEGADLTAEALAKAVKGSKSALQEHLQAAFGEVPEYQVTEEGRAGGEDRFLARVLHRGRLLGEGRGRNKKRAEEAAAAAALAAMEKA